MFSRRKICSKVRMTEVVPAPEEPVTAMMGCLADMLLSLLLGRGFEQAACTEQRRVIFEVVVIAVVALDPFDFIACTEYKSDPLMGRLRLYFENRLVAGTGPPARLLNQEADWIGFVQQTQPPVPGGVLAVAWVHEDTTAHEDPVRFRDQGCDPAHVEITTARALLPRQAFVDIPFDRGLPMAGIGGVDCELGSVGIDGDLGMGQHEFADFPIEREAVDATARGKHQHRRRPIYCVAGTHLLCAGL